MSSEIPFREISPWVETPEDLQSALTDDLQADVVTDQASCCSTSQSSRSSSIS